MKSDIDRLASRLAHDFPGTTYSTDEMDSGVVMVDFWRHGRLVVMCFEPGTGFGADLIDVDSPTGLLDTSFTPAGNTATEAALHLRRLLASV